MPDRFVIAIGPTFMVARAAMVFGAKGTPVVILNAWFAGLFGILAFAFQTILILMTGDASTSAPLIHRVIRSLVALARAPNQAMTTTLLTSAVAPLRNGASA